MASVAVQNRFEITSFRGIVYDFVKYWVFAGNDYAICTQLSGDERSKGLLTEQW